MTSGMRPCPSPATTPCFAPAIQSLMWKWTVYCFVFCGYDPWQGWLASKPWLVHFHIKDWIANAPHGSLAGAGQGRIPEVIADVVKMGYDGFATMEPHLLGGGPTGGVTGPELFPKAVAAFKKILDNAGAKYQ